MTDRTAEIEARLGAATPGPWNLERGVVASVTEPEWQIARACYQHVEGEADLELIANAPADLRHLLDENKRLRESLIECLEPTP